MRRIKSQFAAVVVLALLVSACQTTIPPEALELTAESLKDRQLQTRRFDTKDEGKLLSASAAVLQDLGFTIDESETALGLVVGSKDRDATNAGQVAAAILVALLGGGALPIDSKQKMRASLVTRPIGEESQQMAVRITFQRVVWNSYNEVSKAERLNDPKIYQEFFAKLSKSIFLDAHEL